MNINEKDGLSLPLDPKRLYGFDDLNNLLKRLLDCNGCPWDKEQTLTTLKKYMLEECYEVLDALDNGDMSGLKEELGDLLFQIFFMSKLCEKDGLFDINAVADGVVRKMISRHTHIFGNENAQTAEEVESVWEANKKKEKSYTSLYDELKKVPESLPALIRAEKVLTKSGEHKNTAVEALTAAICLELGNVSKWTEEDKQGRMGSVLLQICDISAKLKINSEFALTNAVKTFINKFRRA